MRHKTSRVSPVGTDKWMSSLLCGAGCGATHLTIFRCVWAIFIKTEKPLSDWGRLHRTLPFIFIDYVDPDFNANHKRSAKPGRMKYKNSSPLGRGTVLQERLAGVLNQVLLQLIIFFLYRYVDLFPGVQFSFKIISSCSQTLWTGKALEKYFSLY